MFKYRLGQNILELNVSFLKYFFKYINEAFNFGGWGQLNYLYKWIKTDNSWNCNDTSLKLFICLHQVYSIIIVILLKYQRTFTEI